MLDMRVAGDNTQLHKQTPTMAADEELLSSVQTVHSVQAI